MEAERPSASCPPDNDDPGDLRAKESPRWKLLEIRPTIGPGLENLGNTCFLNAVLQCLTHTVPIHKSLQSSPHPYPCSRGGDNGLYPGNTGFCSFCSLKQHIEVCISPGTVCVKPSGLVNNLSNISSSFARYQQEDAHEFLNTLLDHIHNCCLNRSPASENSESAQPTSFIYDIFAGRLRSQVQCCECGHRSNTYEPFLDLSLEIQEAETLEQALESFTQVETIDDPQVKVTCDGCGSRVSVNKQLTLESLPPVIPFHLKRFDADGYYGTKNDKFVKFPKSLDLSPFLSDPSASTEDVKYDLYAAVMHQGHLALQGHYYCFVRAAPDSWFIMDDDRVYRIKEEEALSHSAYILFYMKQGTRWFSHFMDPTESDRVKSPASVVDHARGVLERERPADKVSLERTENEEKPSTPKESSFFEEPWDEGQKRFREREMVAAGSCLRAMPKARRQRLEELMGRTGDDTLKKPRMHLDPALLQEIVNGRN